MPRPCTICGHPQRKALDLAMAADEPNRRIASHYGVSERAVRHHKAKHLPASLVKGDQARQEARALDVLGQLKAINAASLAILKQARAVGDHDTALRAIDRVQRQIELQAKLLGELDQPPQINIVLSPDWQRLRSVILDALEPFGAARLAVAGALRKIEATHGDG